MFMKYLPRVPGFIRRDFLRKFMALFLTVLLYFWVAWKLRSDQSVTDVPVLLSLPADYVCRDEAAPKVSLRISGNKGRLAEVLPAAVRIRAEVAPALLKSGPCTVRLRASDVTGLPFGVHVAQIAPRDVVVHLERVVSKSVPIKPRFDSVSNLPLDYTVGETRFTPVEVVLTGPESLLAPLTEVYTEFIPLDKGVRESFSFKPKLRIPNNLRSDREQVEANVEIIKALTERTFAAVRLQVVQSPGGAADLVAKSINPKEVTVKVKGPKGMLSDMHSEELKAYLDIDALDKPGTFKLPIKVVLDSARRDVTVQSFQPVAAEVVVRGR